VITRARRRDGARHVADPAMTRLALVALGIVAIAGCAVAPSPSVPPTAQPPTSLQPVATPAAAPTSTPSPTPSPAAAAGPTGEVRWERIGSLGDEYDLQDAVGFENGYVAVYGGGVRFSTDGVTWKPVELPHGKGVAYTVAVDTDGHRVIVVGATSPCASGADPGEDGAPVPPRCVERPASWVSDDGRTWSMSRRWTGAVSGADKVGSRFDDVWTVPTGGWDAAQGFWEGDLEGPSSRDLAALWHSQDGLAWSLLRDLPAEPVAYCYGGPSARAGPDGRRVVIDMGDDCDGDGDQGSSLSSSVDGRGYRPLDAAQLARGDVITAALAPAPVGPWVFVGHRFSDIDSPANVAVAWSSKDLVTWAKATMPVPIGVNASATTVARLGPGYVATGGGLTWLSDDGATWRLADVTSETGWGIEEIASGPAGTLGLGPVKVSDDETRVDVFRLSDLR
jgi:hypothetical protein